MASPSLGRLAAAVVGGGLTGGLIDFVGACLIYGLPPLTVGKAVARGWFGPSAMKAGNDVALIGVASHFGILVIAAAIYVALALRISVLRAQPLIAGLACGLGVYLVMHFVVVPLSAAPNNQPHGAAFWKELASHLLVGVAFACWARAMLGRPA